MDSQDLEKEITELWRRVRGEEPGPDPMPFETPPSPGAFAARRYEAELSELKDALDTREKSVEGLKARAAAAEAELAKSRGRLDREQDLFLQQLLAASSALEDAQRSLGSTREERRRELAAAQKRHQDELLASRRKAAEELAASESALAEARAELAKEKSRWEQLQAYWKSLEKKWQEKETHLAAKSRALEDEAKRIQHLGEASDRENKQLAERFAQLETELNGLREQLAAERRSGSEAREGLGSASTKVTELEGRLREVQAAWDEERRQWREMWDREHNAWETQRQEFEQWEEKLRREREAWLEQMRSKEAEEVDAAAKLTDVLKNSSEIVALKDRLARQGASAGAPAPLFRAPSPKSALLAALGAALLAGAWWVFGQAHILQRSELVVALKRPTALAASPDTVYFAEWDGVVAAAPASDPGRLSRRVQLPAPFHPLSLSWTREALWALDAASAGVLRLDPADPSRTSGERLTPAAAVASAAAFDGRELWTYDAASRLLWRQSPGGGQARSLAAPEGLWPASLGWSGGDLWAYDSKSGLLWRLRPSEEKVRVLQRLALPGRPLAAAVSEKTLWTLAPAGADRYQLRRYRLWP